MQHHCRMNLLLVCRSCHNAFHALSDDQNGLRVCHAVWVQQELLGEEFDLELLNSLGIGRVFPEALPQFYLEQRRINGRVFIFRSNREPGL